VDANIAHAPGAEDNPLAVWAGDLVAQNVSDKPRVRRDFEALRAAVVMVAPDRRLQVTMRFDHGYLTIHDGMIGIPDVTFCADYEVLMGIADFPLSKYGHLPLPPLSRSRLASWRRTFVELVSGELKIYGMLSHPRLVTRVVRVLSRNG
jgi:hypothetical protein